MIQTTYKKIPFDLELAKKITNKEVKRTQCNARRTEGENYFLRYVVYEFE